MNLGRAAEGNHDHEVAPEGADPDLGSVRTNNKSEETEERAER